MFRRLPFLAALLSALAFAAPAHALDRPGLARTLAKLEGRMGSSAGAYVLDLGTGQPIYARQENLALAPASKHRALPYLRRLSPGSTSAMV